MVLARNAASQRDLNHQFAERQVHKTYLAIVAGKLEKSSGNISLPLICDWPNRPRQKVDQQTGKPAQTRYRLIQYDPISDSSRVELVPITGRTHQLRVHLQALGHPILGDDLYADEANDNKSERLLLHASRLEFIHPTTNQLLKFELQPPF
jgi:tRNA pseudouridine32 synthase/23S rRNA pseudouridine746 synthase